MFSDVTRVWYLQGYYEHYSSKSDAYDDFMMTAAHESGHPILASYAYKSTGLNNYSWVHKGSCKGVLSGYNTPEKGEKGHESKPQKGHVDLMKYYNYRIAPNLFRAIDYDLKSLIWLSFVKFGGKK